MPASLRYVVGSDNYLWVYRLLHPVTGKAVTDQASAISVTIFDVDGVTPLWGVGSLLLAPAFTYVPNTKSDYRVVIPGNLPVTLAKYYTVRVDITIAGIHRALEGTMFVVTEDY